MRDDEPQAEDDDGPTDEDMVHHAATVPISFIQEALDVTPPDEAQTIVRLARSEMLRLMRDMGMQSAHNPFFHRLPHRSALIYFIVGTPEDVQIDGIPPEEWPPAFLRPPADGPEGVSGA